MNGRRSNEPSIHAVSGVTYTILGVSEAREMALTEARQERTKDVHQRVNILKDRDGS